ncbi:MAG: hypothetical protein M0012_00330 [Deltaproteobacteria bacterium]|nr:hypothetical protein [Deltaproteobacteria bacterium]
MPTALKRTRRSGLGHPLGEKLNSGIVIPKEAGIQYLLYIKTILIVSNGDLRLLL